MSAKHRQTNTQKPSPEKWSGFWKVENFLHYHRKPNCLKFKREREREGDKEKERGRGREREREREREILNMAYSSMLSKGERGVVNE